MNGGIELAGASVTDIVDVVCAVVVGVALDNGTGGVG